MQSSCVKLYRNPVALLLQFSHGQVALPKRNTYAPRIPKPDEANPAVTASNAPQRVGLARLAARAGRAAYAELAVDGGAVGHG